MKHSKTIAVLNLVFAAIVAGFAVIMVIIYSRLQSLYDQMAAESNPIFFFLITGLWVLLIIFNLCAGVFSLKTKKEIYAKFGLGMLISTAIVGFLTIGLYILSVILPIYSLSQNF